MSNKMSKTSSLKPSSSFFRISEQYTNVFEALGMNMWCWVGIKPRAHTCKACATSELPTATPFFMIQKRMPGFIIII